MNIQASEAIIPTEGVSRRPLVAAGVPGAAQGALLVGFLAVVLGAGATASPILTAGAVVGAAFVAFTMRDLALGIALFTVLTFFEEIPGIPSAGLSFMKVAGGVLALSWVLALVAPKRDVPFLPRERPAVGYAAIFFVALAIGSRLWSVDIERAQLQSFRLCLVVVLLFIVFSAIRDHRHLRWFVLAFVAGGVLSALVGLVETSPEAAGSDYGRLEQAGIRDPNELAALLVPALVFAAFGIPAFRSSAVRWALGASVAIIAVALVLTESRGGLVALSVTLIAAVLLGGRMRARAIVVLLLVAAVASAYYTLFAPPESVERVANITKGGGTGREDLWTIAVQVARDHPVLGVGIGNFPIVNAEYAATTMNVESGAVVDERKSVHNTYLEVLTELGPLGLLAFITIVAASLRAGLSSFRMFRESKEPEMESLARGIVIGAIGMLAAYVFISAEYEKQLWLVLGLVLALSSIARRRREQERGQPSTTS